LILRYADELSQAETYFETLDAKVKDHAVKLAVDLIEDNRM